MNNQTYTLTWGKCGRHDLVQVDNYRLRKGLNVPVRLTNRGYYTHFELKVADVTGPEARAPSRVNFVHCTDACTEETPAEPIADYVVDKVDVEKGVVHGRITFLQLAKASGQTKGVKVKFIWDANEHMEATRVESGIMIVVSRLGKSKYVKKRDKAAKPAKRKAGEEEEEEGEEENKGPTSPQRSEKRQKPAAEEDEDADGPFTPPPPLMGNPASHDLIADLLDQPFKTFTPSSTDPVLAELRLLRQAQERTNALLAQLVAATVAGQDQRNVK